jgi:hypothetical protein
MAEIRTVTTLIAKRDEIEAAITNYERRLEQVRADLSHVNACIALFEACHAPGGTRAYVDLHRIFARGEMMRLCKDALATGPKTTKELSLIVMAAKGLDTGDKVLARAMATRMIHALRQQGAGAVSMGTERSRARGFGPCLIDLPDIEADLDSQYICTLSSHFGGILNVRLVNS